MGSGCGGGGSGSGSGGGFGGTGFGSGPGSGSGGPGSGGGTSGGGDAAPRHGRWASATALLRETRSGPPPFPLASGGLGSLGGIGVSDAGAGSLRVEEEDLRSLLTLFAPLGPARKDP